MLWSKPAIIERCLLFFWKCREINCQWPGTDEITVVRIRWDKDAHKNSFDKLGVCFYGCSTSNKRLKQQYADHQPSQSTRSILPTFVEKHAWELNKYLEKLIMNKGWKRPSFQLELEGKVKNTSWFQPALAAMPSTKPRGVFFSKSKPRWISDDQRYMKFNTPRRKDLIQAI